MNIIIGGSMSFAKEQVEIKKELEEKGHVAWLSDDINHYVNSPEIKDDPEDELKLTKETDIMRIFFNKIGENDAFLIYNPDKRGIKGYLGTSVLMEMGLAYHLRKKIYLFYDYDKTQNYGVEVGIINPIILNGDLDKIE